MHRPWVPYALRMTVDLRTLRALVAVVDEGTFTDAAIALGTSQASVSRAVADLERSLEARLLQRTSQGAVPTVHGRRVTEHARRVLAEIGLIERLSEPAGSQLRVGFAWSTFGRRTTSIQRRWQAEHPDGTLTFVHSATATAGLLDGEADIAVVRRPVHDHRFEASLVGVEARLAAVAADDPLARRRRITLADLSRRPIAIDHATGTTTPALWPSGAGPTQLREVHGIEEWLTVVSTGQAVGVTTEATADQFPRSTIRYRPLKDAPPIAVSLVWWRDAPPAGAAAFRRLVCELYADP